MNWEGHLFFWKKFLENNITYTEEGILVNSGQFSGLSSEEARKKIVEFVVGKQVAKYRLRDWVFSRQRYWGEPIPLIHCERCGIVPVPEKDLPVKLPNVKNYEPTGTGESPLANIDSWVKTPCSKCIEDSKKTKYLVFDFDGVIGDTKEATLKNYIAIGLATDTETGEKVISEWFDRKPKHMSQNEFKKEEHEERVKRIKEFGTSFLQFKMGLFNDFVKEIKKLKNVKLAIVSAGSALYVKPLVKKSGIKFSHVFTGEDSMKKGDSVLKVAKDWKIDPKEIYYFTDAISDYYELEHFINPKRIIGCAWGFLGEEKLKKLFADTEILKKPKDIHNLFKPLIGKRETNTMPQWAGSSWYWLRYMDPKNKSEFSSIKAQKYWSPVDLYFGGMEHTTLHLLYSRFWNQFLFDRGLVTVKEPYKKRVPHGIILGPDGEKMSKSRGNVVNPDELVKLYGADTVRLYMMFLGPHGAQVAWNDKGIIGARRFIEKVFSLSDLISKEESKTVTIAINKTIKKVSADIEDFAFNTAVSSLMICVNTVFEEKQITKDSYKKLLVILSSFIPHATEELWAKLGSKKSIFEESFPQFYEKLIAEEKINIAVQINGKTRAILSVSKDISDEDLTSEALKDPKIEALVKGLKIQKTIVIKGKIVSFVVSN
jgi:leucyl-tRNA synthetase/FMN phosphatase YigB (HAD superfamily)